MFDTAPAVPVWGDQFQNQYNQFAGFYTEISYEGEAVFAIAARSYYRLYINGRMLASGPARCAQGYCRVDEIPVTMHGMTHIAIEVAAYAKPEKYCNDCTMEPGMLLVRIADPAGNVLSATGDGNWKWTELTMRRAEVETMSHSRPILEYYDLTPDSFAWRTGKAQWKVPVPVAETIRFLKRRAPYPTYRALAMDPVRKIADITASDTGSAPGRILEIARAFNASWYASLPEKNVFVESLLKEKEDIFTGSFKRLPSGALHVLPGQHPFALIYEREASEIGFIDLEITVGRACTLDIINSDHRSFFGEMRANSYVTRYMLAPGKYHLTTFEPKLTRFLKLICRTEGEIQVSLPVLLDDSYPDTGESGFTCSDGDLNRIYQAARRTLRLNTLDIFMDCPQRERGGWLCDSQFTAMAAWSLFSDLSVEKDFIENFMLTDPDVTFRGFFPEVYPGVHKTPEEVGIPNWSFWLLTELADYYVRSGDQVFIEACRKRVERFVEGMLSLRGSSGLIENLDGQFVDWSISNKDFNMTPISVPNNCLAVHALERMADLYHREDWLEAAASMRDILSRLPVSDIMGNGGDAAQLTTMPFGPMAGQEVLTRTGCETEAGAALEIWSGFHRDDDAYMRKFLYTQGPFPSYRSNPNVGKANLFIGIMIRFDVLFQMGRIEQLVHEIKAVYLPELRDGSGTFFENYNAVSGCHGFNSAAGAMSKEKVLGLGAISEKDKSVVFAPNPCGLRWANGSSVCSDGSIFVEWSADEEAKRFMASLQLPEGWHFELQLPDSLKEWEITFVHN